MFDWLGTPHESDPPFHAQCLPTELALAVDGPRNHTRGMALALPIANSLHRLGVVATTAHYDETALHELCISDALETTADGAEQVYPKRFGVYLQPPLRSPTNFAIHWHIIFPHLLKHSFVAHGSTLLKYVAFLPSLHY